MWLRITLWALLIGTFVMGYLGYQAGSATTTLVGALVLAFILFLLYFLAKHLLGFGAVIFKIIIVVGLIAMVVIGLIKGVSMLMNKTKEFSNSTSVAVSEQVGNIQQKWNENGEADEDSWFSKLKKNLMKTPAQTEQETPILQPSKTYPKQEPVSVDKHGNISRAVHFSGIVNEIRTGYLFRIKNHFIKLYAIDTPDPSQTCFDRQGEIYPCGKLAKNKLKQLILNRHLICSLVATDGAGNYVATCRIGEYDVGAAMVSSGWAVANRLSSPAYIPYEIEARNARKGLWEGKFVSPWRYRNQ